jgi:hypothetical protein
MYLIWMNGRPPGETKASASEAALAQTLKVCDCAIDTLHRTIESYGT